MPAIAVAGLHLIDMPRAFIVGLSGPKLTDAEASFLRAASPAGLIIFKRNAKAPDQLERLIAEAREAVGDVDLLFMVDQEGGRVQRLLGSRWPQLPPARSYADRFGTEAHGPQACRHAYLIAQLTALQLRSVGINTNCVPCVDKPVVGAHEVIGQRAYGEQIEVIVPLARAVAEAHLSLGVLPVMKHIPGHGRANADSHFTLPRVETDRSVLEETDFKIFRDLRDLPVAMTAHVVYTAIDAEHAATASPKIIGKIVRESIGFAGLLVSDDISMKALVGPLGERVKRALGAGCDLILHCNGRLDEMEQVAASARELAGASLTRYRHCVKLTKVQPSSFNIKEAEIALATQMAFVSTSTS
ncbi:MAG: beta-N-acetylhexosaminidase [Hyphomicrobiaceae bacterium]